MNFEKYTTQELEFITSNVELLKKALQTRRIKELDKFPFKVGDIIALKENNGGNYFIKIKKIDERYNQIYVDEIVSRHDASFDMDIDECFGINNVDWVRYAKVEDPDIFENLFNIINKYYDDMQQLHDDTYQKIKNEIEHYE